MHDPHGEAAQHWGLPFMQVQTARALADQHKGVCKRQGLALPTQLSTRKHLVQWPHSRDLAPLMDRTNSWLLLTGLAFSWLSSHPTPHTATGSGSCCGVATSPRTALDWWVATTTAERWHGRRAAQSSRSTSLAPARFPGEGRRNSPNPLHRTCAKRHCSGYLRDYRGRVSECQGSTAPSLPSHCMATGRSYVETFVHLWPCRNRCRGRAGTGSL